MITRFAKSLIIIAVIVSLVLGVSCSPSSSPTNTTPPPSSSSPSPESTSPAPLEYDRLNNFNGQFSIDYPRGWDYSFVESSDPHYPPCTEFIGSIGENVATIEVYFDASVIYPDMFGVDYQTVMDDLLNAIPFTMIYNGHEYPLTELIEKDVTCPNNTIYSIFRIYIYRVYVCGIDGGKTYMEIQARCPFDFPVEFTDTLAEICLHMVESLQVTNN